MTKRKCDGWWAVVAATLIAISTPTARAQEASAAAALPNSIQSLVVAQQAATSVIKIDLSAEPTAPPSYFAIANPPRVIFDFPGTGNNLGRNLQQVNEGDLNSINIVQAGDRTRVVFNLKQMGIVETRAEGKSFIITLAPNVAAPAQTAPTQHFAETAGGTADHAIRDIVFRRGKAGEGLVTVDMSDPNTGINVRQEGANLVVDFAKASLPERLRRRLDVTDFATPVTTVTTTTQGENVRLTIAPQGLWEHTAYQTDNQFIVEVRPLKEDPSKIFQGSRGQGFHGERVSLNFQNIPLRELLHVFADITNFNIVISDTVAGSISLRLNDVPWDQALDIVLQQKGLDMRKNGNVILIAPRDELAAKEKLQLEAKQQISVLEPARTESFQLNYQKAADVQKLLSAKDQRLLSSRGSVIADARTNKIFVTDAPTNLEQVRAFIHEIDIAMRQVLIEARIVEAQDTFSKALGVRLGGQDPLGQTVGHKILGLDGLRYGISGTENMSPGTAMGVQNFVNLPVTSPTGTFAVSLFNSDMSRYLTLEISAQESDGKLKTISSPRILTADQVEAEIKQGTKVPYAQATSSGATSITYQDAVMSLKVKPQITADGKVKMTLNINKDELGTLITGLGYTINTKHIQTDVVVENGGTVVIGGIYEQNQNKTVGRVPVLGELPVVGFMFRNTQLQDNKTELMVFITPKIVAEDVALH